ncbi:unnamed protein product [Haemonchus placei]|uniref:DUF659 domain-containing protein n=1 Tax=Haemonchus placei TaxID=6290 RepID=A0A0N4W2W5_HAEPC|nr:unnamed protein product [Haemonchus placei]
MVAYSVCTEWTEFICTTKSIAKHEPIEQNCIIEFYRVAFEDLKKELQQDEREARSSRKGPTGFAAPEGALLMEQNDSKGGLTTKVVPTYKQLRNTLQDWTTFAIWVIVYPLESRGDKKIICDILRIAKSHLENGGKIVTAWSPLTAKKEKEWRIMMNFWRMLDEILVKMGGEDQVVTTSNSRIMDGKIYMEAGSPEASANFHNPYLGVGAAKTLYLSVRERAKGIKLPEIEQSSGTATTRMGGMWNREAKRKAPSRGGPPSKRGGSC